MPQDRADRRAVLWIAAIVGVGVILRLAVLRSPGFPSDVGTFMAWAERLAQLGPWRFYEPGYFSDYPPGYLYVLWLLGALFDGEALRLAVKAMSIPADIAITVIAARLAWRAAGRAHAILAAALWMLAPGPIFAGPYWGQVDAVGTVPFFAALVLAGRGRWGWAGACAGVAAMVKPQFGLALVIVAAAALIEWARESDWRPTGRSLAAAAAAIVLLGLPFRSGPAELVALVRSAAETYPYTSLYAFNLWSVVADFWKPDDRYVVTGTLLLLVGVAASCALLWRRRDVAALLAAGALAACAFYFLPTRAHERYLFPAFALLLPLAVVRWRLLVAYAVLAISFAASLYFAFTRYPQNDLRAPGWLEETLFARNGQIALALVMLAAAAYLAWRLVRADDVLEADLDLEEGTPPERHAARAPRRWALPAALAPGGIPTRRDIAVAFLVALVVLGTRAYRLDHPRDMYFDEIYHARTAFELLAQREPYEWTHPHLAKEVMALGILAFGDDRVTGDEPAVAGAVAFAVANDGTRAFAGGPNGLLLRSRDGRVLARAPLDVLPRALAFDGDDVVVVTDRITRYGRDLRPAATAPLPTAVGRVRALAVANGRVAVGGEAGTVLYGSVGAAPQALPYPAVALAWKTDGSQLFLLEAEGTVRFVEPATAQVTATLNARGPATAIAYAQSPDRVFVARADTPALDVLDLASRATDTVPLANGRTGTFAGGASALAMVPRTQFLYALADGRVVVVEPHGASPFAAIPVHLGARWLGVDGEGDTLLVASDGGVQRIETGRHGLAWRLPGALSGAALAFFLVLLARRLFRSPLVAYLAGAIVVLDTSMYAQARIGMNDIYVMTFVVAAWYFIVAAHRPRRAAWLDLVVAGLLTGLAMASKWAGVYTLAGIFLATVAVTARAFEAGRPGTGGPLDLLGGRGRNAAVLFGSFALIPAAVYLASYASWFGGPTQPYGWSLWELTQQMYWYHSSLTAPHCSGSPWWAWPVDLRPVYWYFGQSAGGLNGYIYNPGNPVLYWLALPATAIVAGLAIRLRSAALGLVVLAGLVQFVAWIPISRVLFFYHFFTALPFYLLCLAIVLALAWERRRRGVLAAVGVAAAVAALLYPFVSAVPIPGEFARVYFAIPTWNHDPAFSPADSCSSPMSSGAAQVLTIGIAWAYELAAVALFAAVALGRPLADRILARLGIATD